MKALILAAGYATRLYPLTKEYPKPLLEVGGRPLIDFLIDKLEEVERIDEISVVSNSKFFPNFKRWKSGLHTKKRVSLVDDLTASKEDRRGAIGDMHFAVAKKRLNSDLLVVGGDNLFDGDLNDFLAFAQTKDKSPVIGVYNIKEKLKARQYGVVKLDANNRIIDFKEKPRNPQSALVAMCLYYFPKEKLYLLEDYVSGIGKCDAAGFYIDWLRKKVPVYSYIFEGRWYDIGHHDFYQEARNSFK